MDGDRETLGGCEGYDIIEESVIYVGGGKVVVTTVKMRNASVTCPCIDMK